MNYLSAGPYDFSKGTCEVSDEDGRLMVEKSPGTFSETVPQQEEVYACPACEKTYKREGDLSNHIKKEHPELVVE